MDDCDDDGLGGFEWSVTQAYRQATDGHTQAQRGPSWLAHSSELGEGRAPVAVCELLLCELKLATTARHLHYCCTAHLCALATVQFARRHLCATAPVNLISFS